MRRFILAQVFILQTSTVFSATYPIEGVWQGKLGTLDIVACFNDERSGSYYYTHQKKPIQLSREEQGSLWSEEGKTGSWKLDIPRSNNVQGIWRDHKNGKSLTIALSSQSNVSDDRPCASSEYNTALEDFPELKMGTVKDFNGRKYRKLRIADVETIELLANGPSVVKVNQKLHALLPKSKADVEEYFSKRREFLGNTGYAAEDETFAEPYYWSDNWLTVHYYRWAAGFGVRGVSLDYRTWNMRTGEEVDLWKWFGAQSYSYNQMAPLPERLKKYLIKDSEIAADCKHEYYGEGDYHLTLEPTGIKFWESAFGDGCEKEFTIPYKKLGPFLSPEGKAAIRSFVKH